MPDRVHRVNYQQGCPIEKWINAMTFKTIAHIYTDFEEKFGIPRQSNLVPDLKGQIVFTKEYRNPDALRGLEAYDYIWLIWHFSETPERETWSPMVRPPRLGGNERVGVFASRSPNRPNPVGLSSVRLEGIEWDTPKGPILHVAGADLLSGTPIIDIKPYQTHSDSHPDARAGFADRFRDYSLQVDCPEDLLEMIPIEKRQALLKVLSHDPRPGYQSEASRVYGMAFAGYNVKFQVSDRLLTVTEIDKE